MSGAVIGALRAELSASIAQFTADMGKAGAEVSKFQKTFKSAGAAMQKAGAVMSVAVTAPLVAFGVQASKAATESAQAMGQVNAALASMGPVAGRTAEQLQKNATALMGLSTFDDDEILQKVTANLLTFGNVSGAQFDRAQRAAVDMATRLKMDLQPATIAIGKALNDPIKGMTALSRVGIQFTADQKAVIEQMVATGNVAGAQSVILAELERQFGGAGKAMQDATPGDETKDAWNSFQEVVGQIINQVLPPLTSLLTGVLNAFNTLDPAMQTVIVTFGAIVAAVGPIITVIGTMVSAIGTIGPALLAVGRVITSLLVASGPIGWLALALAGIVTVWQNWDTIGPIVQRLYTAVKTWIMDKLGAVFSWVKDKITGVTNAFRDMYIAVVGNSYVPDMVDGIAAEMGRLPSEMVDPAVDAAGDVGTAFERTAESVGQSLGQMLNDGKVTFGEIKDLAGQLLQNILPSLFGGQGGGGSGGGGFLGGLLSGVAGAFGGGGGFGGFLAEGGRAVPGRSYIVGENGPEVFRPATGGDVIPNGESPGGRSMTQVFNIKTPDANSFRASQRQIARQGRQQLGMA